MKVIPDFIKDMLLLRKLHQSGYYIMMIENPSEKLQMAAVKNSADNIRYIKNPSEKVQLEVVQRDPFAIRNIGNPTEKVQLEAVQRKPFMIKYIDNPSEKAQLDVVQKKPFLFCEINHPTTEVIYEALKSSPYNIKYVSDPTKEMQLLAVKDDISNIGLLSNPHKDVQLDVVTRNPYTIRQIHNPDRSVCLVAAAKVCDVEIGDVDPAADIVGATNYLFERLSNIDRTYDSLMLSALYADNYEIRRKEIDEADDWRSEAEAGAIMNFKNSVVVNELYRRISDISIYPLNNGEKAIRCKIDGVEQSAMNLSKEDRIACEHWVDTREYAAKYFKDALNKDEEIHISMKR